MKKIGILTSGGDCQGLNVAIRGLAKSLFKEFGENIEIYGIKDGYKGLIEGNYKLMERSDFSGILTVGGTILGTSRQPFKTMQVEDENSVDKVDLMKENYKKMELDCLVILGGNGTHKTANLLSENGLNVVTLPKTIDNDLWGTEMTFGFHSAMDIATEVIDRVHTTATSHGRIFVVEIMGHKAGWLTLCSGIAGGADIILIPEIPYDIDNILNEIEERSKAGKMFTIIAMAEGALSKEESKMSKKELRDNYLTRQFPSVSYRLEHELSNRIENEIRVVVPGHIQRGGSPSPHDRFLSTRFGAAAAALIKDKKYGNMVSLKDDEIVAVPLGEVAGKLKLVPKDSGIVKSAKEIGIILGD